MIKRIIKTLTFSAVLCLVLAGVVNGWHTLIMFIIFMVALLVWEWYIEKD